MDKKKLLAVLMAATLTFTACGGGSDAPADDDKGGEEGAEEEMTTAITDYQEATNREVTNMDYVTSALTSDHEINANLIDGLLEQDNRGEIVPSIAESWEPNDDATEWTFHIRPDVKWVTNQGEEAGNVTADDFVTGLRHAVEFNSGAIPVVQDVIEGLSDYMTSDFSDEEWDKVGVKAVDENTLVYTLTAPTPYFDSITTYNILYPIQREFLEAQGEGCKLGEPDTDNCDFGNLQLDSILYNGAYILTENTAKSKAVLTKNPAYWDADHVYLDTITRIYDDGQDPYSTINGFEAGTYQQAGLNPTWKDYDEYVEKYDGQTHYSIPNSTTFGLVFNYNRAIFNETNYAEDETLRENTREAVKNENFRKALRASMDLVAHNAVDAPKDLAKATIRNINNFPGAGTLEDGTGYFELVTDAYNEMTGEDRDLSDGQAAFYDPDAAKEYIEKAKEDGIKFPIHLDMLVVETSDRIVKKGQSLKQSVEDATDGQIIIELVLRDEDTVQNIAYLNDDPKAMDYDISTFTGWGPDFADPKSFVDIYSPTTGYYMHPMGMETMEENDKGEMVVADEDLKEDLGFMEYEKLYRDADAVVDDMDERYKAFAKADAYLIDKCLYIPTSMDLRSNLVTKVVPFSRQYSEYGLGEYKYKGLRIADHIITTDEYNKAYEEWKQND